MRPLRVLLICLAALLGAAHPDAGALAPAAYAQSQEQSDAPDYESWARTAGRADTAIEAGRASDAAFEALREELVGWRDVFSQAQNINKSRIETLTAQIEALGPVPESGAEPAEISARRSELEVALANARAPVLRADEAYRQADGLIRQVDGIIRERRSEKLLELFPTPLNPVHWGRGLSVLSQSAVSIGEEVSVNWNNSVQHAEFKNALPLVIVLTAIGLVLLARGRHWAEALTAGVAEADRIAWRWLLGFAVSLGQVVLPFLGLYALTAAAEATGMTGLRADSLLSALPGAGLAFFVARWLGARMFPPPEAQHAYFHLPAEALAQGRWFSAGLGFVTGADVLLVSLSDFPGYPDEAKVVLVYPLLVVAALMTFRLGQLLGLHVQAVRDEEEELTFRDRMIRLLARAVLVATVAGVVLGAVGYMALGTRLVFSTGMTLAVLAMVLILQRLAAEIYAVATGRPDGARDALVPVLIGFLLAVASAPVLALIWGARVATLNEYWTRFVAGFSVGDIRISPSIFLTFAVFFAAGYMLTRLVQGALRNTVLPKTRIDAGGRNAIISGTGYIGIFLAAIVAITAAGIDLSSLAIVAGALSVGIGFGLQNIVSNFVSGIILLIERPISEGDWIEVAGNSGYVRDISVRSTRIETFDRADVIVPNADLISGVVVNMTKDSLMGRVIVPVGVAYGVDTKRVETILQEIAQAHPMVVLNPEPSVVFSGFGASSLDFEIRAYLRDVNWILSVTSEMNHEIARRFAEEGIEIPFSQHDIWLRNPEALRGTRRQGPPRPPEIDPGGAAGRHVEAEPEGISNSDGEGE